MRKSEKLYSGGMIVELICIFLSFAHVSLPLNIYFAYLPDLTLFLPLIATVIFLIGILCVTFGRNAEKSEMWFHNVSNVFSAYEQAKAKVA